MGPVPCPKDESRSALIAPVKPFILQVQSNKIATENQCVDLLSVYCPTLHNVTFSCTIVLTDISH